ncbi:MAG TPA: electron transfer flavoprotein subunit beta/FixA family protein [Candidatus Dormibacteraeota bacterium]|nr:electron transfer flavoprotein subunit beta/FixA family protein [Candidatus Dormibacteraeota bacterium]
MHIAVVLKQVPDLVEELEIDSGGKDIDRSFVKMKLNEFDDHALEQAILLKESSGARVTAVAVAADGIDQVLYAAKARGADAAMKVDAGEEVLDSRRASSALAGAIKQLAPDLVLVGVQAADDLFGQTGPFLAAALGWPHVSVVSGVELAGEAGSKVRVHQEYAGGRMAILEVDPPVVIGVQAAPQPPRYVPVTRLRQAMASGPIESSSATAAAAESGVAVVAVSKPEAGKGAEMISGSATDVAEKIAALLGERGLVRG